MNQFSRNTPLKRIKTVAKATHAHLPYRLRQVIGRCVETQYVNYLQQLRQAEGNQFTLRSFDRLRCIFVHIPKTGGISIAKSLFGNWGGGHIKIRGYQLLYSRADYNDYFKFAFVRNPWDRLLSAYTFYRKGGLREADRRWTAEHLADFADFDAFVKGWVNRENVCKHVLFVPQYEFVCLQNKPTLDFIGRFENFAQDFEAVRKRLGIDTELQYLNVSKHRGYQSQYNETTKQIVANVYREDIEIFGYAFDNVT
jgi:hypothetical protein